MIDASDAKLRVKIVDTISDSVKLFFDSLTTLEEVGNGYCEEEEGG
jgi:hypothetical protein